MAEVLKQGKAGRYPLIWPSARISPEKQSAQFIPLAGDIPFAR
jgi:hypothetical protein